MSRFEKIVLWIVLVALAVLLLLAGVSRRTAVDMVTTFYGVVPPADIPKGEV